MSDEYMDCEYFVYSSIIIEYRNNFPCIIAFCENILNGTYIIKNKHKNKNKNKIRMLCISNDSLTSLDSLDSLDSLESYNIEDIQIYNSDSIFIKDIINSDYIDLNEMYEESKQYIFILYLIANNNINIIMISKNKDKIFKKQNNLHNVYIIKVKINKPYNSQYDMESFIHKV